MDQVNLAVIFYSSTGANYQLAQWAADAASQAGASVKLLKVKETAPQEAINQNEAWKANTEALKDVPEASLNDLEWADALIFSSPTRYGHITSQLQQFMDGTGGLWSQGKLANKVVSAMASASTLHGGQESTVQAIYTTMMHWGAIIVPPGYTDQVVFAGGGNPYGTSALVDQQGKMENHDAVREAVVHQAKRTVTTAQWLKAGMKAGG